MNVYKWPCVGVVGREWTVEDPVSRSQSLITGAMYLSAAKRRRRKAVMQVSGRSHDDQGAGYMEALKRLLKGGLHAVRLNSYPINFRHGPVPDSIRQSWPLAWETGAGADLAWRAGSGPNGLRWFTGGYVDANGVGRIAIATKLATSPNGFGKLNVTGLPPNARVARVGEFVRVYGATQDTRMLIRPVLSDANGEATVWLDSETEGGGRINFGIPETGVFLPDEIPRVVRPNIGNWTYDWAFTQIFEDEIGDSFVEVDPWG